MARKPRAVPAEKDPDTDATVFAPFGLDEHGRVQADAGQEGAQAVHEYVNHHSGRIEDADKGPDYSGCIQTYRSRSDKS